MFWDIAKREILDSLMSLKFVLALLIASVLMVVGGLGFIRSDYNVRLNRYSDDVTHQMEGIRNNCGNLSTLATEGPGRLHKRPNPFEFCVSDREKWLPGNIDCSTHRSHGVGRKDFSYSWKSVWVISYHGDRPLKNPFIRDFMNIDWSFTIGVILSFVAIIFTFDSISGERERGTLPLLLSNSVPKSSVILGKFVSALITISIPLLIGVIINLLIVDFSGTASVSGLDLGRIGVILVVSLVYLSLFISLGILVSASFGRSPLSLITLLLVWAIFTIVIPNSLGVLSARLRRAPSINELSERHGALRENLKGRYPEEKLYASSPSESPPEIGALRLWADYLTDESSGYTDINNWFVDKQLRQVRFGRMIARVSPTALYNYALEAIAGIGFPRHVAFIEQVRNYRQVFIDFMRTADRADPGSYHIYPVKEGISQKTVDFESVPKFKENLSLGYSINRALVDIAFLGIGAVVAFMLAYLSFIRSGVTAIIV